MPIIIAITSCLAAISASIARGDEAFIRSRCQTRTVEGKKNINLIETSILDLNDEKIIDVIAFPDSSGFMIPSQTTTIGISADKICAANVSFGSGVVFREISRSAPAVEPGEIVQKCLNIMERASSNERPIAWSSDCQSFDVPQLDNPVGVWDNISIVSIVASDGGWNILLSLMKIKGGTEMGFIRRETTVKLRRAWWSDRLYPESQLLLIDIAVFVGIIIECVLLIAVRSAWRRWRRKLK